MRTIYGIDMDALHGDTEIYETVEQLRAFVDTVFLPPGHLMEVFPVLRYLPTWFPLMGAKRTALEGRRHFQATLKGLDAKSTAAFDSVSAFVSCAELNVANARVRYGEHGRQDRKFRTAWSLESCITTGPSPVLTFARCASLSLLPPT